jgi:hypothetical protein
VDVSLSNPNWIQAFATVALVVLTGAALVVLYRYAKDTKTIAEKSVEQSENAGKLLVESQRQADATMQSLALLVGQIKGEHAQEAARAIAVLSAVQEEVTIWLCIIERNKWNIDLPSGGKFMPNDWPVVVYVASRAGIHDEVNSLGKFLADANSHLNSFLGEPVACRNESLIRNAWNPLEEASKSLPKIIEKYQNLEY